MNKLETQEFLDSTMDYLEQGRKFIECRKKYNDFIIEMNEKYHYNEIKKSLTNLNFKELMEEIDELEDEINE